MSRIKVEGYDEMYEPSRYSVSFAFCSAPNEGRKQCMEFESCKAFLQDAVYGQIHNDTVYDDRNCEAPIDINKLRLLVTGEGSESFKKRLYGAKRVLNFYEEIAGWKPSRITKVDHSMYEGVWLVTGPEQWMQAPQLISMVTLLLRMITNEGPIKFKTNKDLEHIYKGWVDEVNSDDSNYMTHCWNKLFLIMKHNKKLFKGFTPETLHVDSPITSHANGIVYLCQFKSATEELNKRFHRLCKENGIKVDDKTS